MVGQIGSPDPSSLVAGERNRNRREPVGGGRELAEGVMAPRFAVTCPSAPPLELPVTCPPRPRSQRWRRDPPVTEAVATAAATAFQPLPSSGFKKRSRTRPDPTRLLTSCRRQYLPPGKFRPKNGGGWAVRS
jgi:hypothetical protein